MWYRAMGAAREKPPVPSSEPCTGLQFWLSIAPWERQPLPLDFSLFRDCSPLTVSWPSDLQPASPIMPHSQVGGRIKSRDESAVRRVLSVDSECSPSRGGEGATVEAAALLLGSGFGRGEVKERGWCHPGDSAGGEQTGGPHGRPRVCLVYPAPGSESPRLSPLLLKCSPSFCTFLSAPFFSHPSSKLL